MFYFLIYNFLSFLAVYFVIKNDINVASSCLQCQEIFANKNELCYTHKFSIFNYIGYCFVVYLFGPFVLIAFTYEFLNENHFLEKFFMRKYIKQQEEKRNYELNSKMNNKKELYR
jgi:hypothetical protein